jgi:hypothetical protein
MPGSGCYACIFFFFYVWSGPFLSLVLFLSSLVIPDYERVTIWILLLDLYLSIIQLLLFISFLLSGCVVSLEGDSYDRDTRLPLRLS